MKPSASEVLRSDLQDVLKNVKLSDSFATSGSLFSTDLLDVEFEVDGVGVVQLPLSSTASQALCDLSRTIHEEEKYSQWDEIGVRNFWDIRAHRVHFGQAMDTLLHEAVGKVKSSLGIGADVK